MEYVLGSLITIGIAFVTNRVYKRKLAKSRLKLPIMSQAYKYKYLQLTYPFLQFEGRRGSNLKTQATDYHDKRSTKIVILQDQAYWIGMGGLQTGIMNESGEVIRDSIKIVDTMSMDSVELDKIITIIDTLTEGKQNDSGNPGHKGVQ